MNLFENLQIMNESNVLCERDDLSVSEYNKLKIALNKDNRMKANFILHPGSVNTDDYRMTIKIYGAFRSYEKTRTAFYGSYGDNFTNDQVTKNGVGVYLYSTYINLIDETVTFSEMRTYDIDRYLNRYENELISNGTVNANEMDLSQLKTSIFEVAEVSKTNLEQALLSKNFIYNLSGTRKIKKDNSSEYNLDLDLENAVLKEDFDSSMPNWLMKSIKLNNDTRGYSHKDINYSMPLDTMKWVVEPFPEKGKLTDINDKQYIALLIDRSGDEHKGDYIVYFPAAHIGQFETIYINGRNRNISSMSLRALAPYVKEYAHTTDYVTDIQNVRQKQQDRAIAQSGSINRDTDNDAYWSRDMRDKSGYIVDPNKYKRLLAQLKHDKYAERLEDLYVVLMDVRDKLKDFMTNDSVIPTPGKKNFSRDNNFNKGTRAYKYYSESLGYYGDALEYLEKIKNGKKDIWGESFEYFTKSIKLSEQSIVNCLTVIQN